MLKTHLAPGEGADAGSTPLIDESAAARDRAAVQAQGRAKGLDDCGKCGETPEDGVFEVFDISRYHPYDIVTSSARELLKVADRQFHDERIAKLTEDLKTVDPGSPEGKRIREQIKDFSIKARMGQTLDPDKITINALTQYLNAVGPLYNAVTGTFFGIPIGLI